LNVFVLTNFVKIMDIDNSKNGQISLVAGWIGSFACFGCAVGLSGKQMCQWRG
jgi:hypothetical protein